VFQAVVLVAVVDSSQPPASSDILGRADDHKTHDEWNHNHCYGFDHVGDRATCGLETMSWRSWVVLR
jgi:hypothetical protein